MTQGDVRTTRTRRGRDEDATTDKNDKNEKKDKKIPKQQNGNGKKNYRDYVKLAPEEFERLIADFGKSQTETMMDILDNYIGAMPKKRNKYTDHNRVLRGWVLERYQKENPVDNPKAPMYQDLN